MQTHLTSGFQTLSHSPSTDALASHAISFQKVLAQLTADSGNDEGTVHLSYLALLFAALLMIVNGLLSVYLSLGLHKTLAVAAIRSDFHLCQVSAESAFCQEVWCIVETRIKQQLCV